MSGNLPTIEYHSKQILHNGKKLETYTFGQGKNVILAIPSYPHSGLSLIMFWLFAQDLDVKFVTFDMPGWIGRSENIFEGSEYDIDKIIDVVETVSAHYNLSQFSVMGYSFGTAVATKFAALNKDKVRKLALVSAVINGNTIQKDWHVRIINLAHKLRAHAAFSSYITSRVSIYKKELYAAGLDKKYMDEYLSLIPNISSRTLLSSIYTLFHSDFTEYLKMLDGKKLLVVNSKDEADFLRHQSEYIRRHIKLENSMYVKGSHEDIITKPEPKNLRKIVKFLIS